MNCSLKIFDFNKKAKPSGAIGDSMEIGWPCALYRVTLPKANREVDDEFNAFERCVIKLLAFKRYELKELAEETCLPVDLIELIVLRLQDRGKIDSQYRLLPGVLEAIDQLAAGRDLGKIEYETCVIFRERVGGRLLPMLVEATLRSEEIDENGRVGEDHVVVRSLKASPNEMNPPTPIEMLSVLRTMAMRRRVSGAAYRIPPAEYISVASEPEKCWLRVRVVMQRSGDWRIMNPFGIGWSPELETTYQEILEQKDSDEAKEFGAWQRRNASRRDKSPVAKGETQPYDTPDNVSRYPELISVLRRRSRVQKMVDVYAAIEWALYYALQCVDLKSIVQRLEVLSREDAQKWLSDALPGDKADAAVRRLCVVPTAIRLQQFQDGAASLQTVLPLSLLVAKDEPRFVFNRLFSVCPDFLPKIADLKKRRDPMRHGKCPWNEIFGEEDMAFMQVVVGTLLPSMKFTSEAESAPESEQDGGPIDDARIDARVAIQDILGVSAFMRMDSLLQNALVKAEIFRGDHANETDKFDALEGVNSLYEATQRSFRPYLVGRLPDLSTVCYAERRAQEMGFGKLPASLRTVRETMLKRTLNGDDQSLQACAVAWLILSDDDVIRRAASRSPSFLEDIDCLIYLRKHGNQRIPMLASEFDSLCKKVINIIKTITEV